ncbi:hypothetical protein [Tardiphaga sp. 839_C3_N1_4]
MLLQEVGESLIGKFLRRRHTVATELDELVEGLVVEVDQLAHDIC